MYIRPSLRTHTHKLFYEDIFYKEQLISHYTTSNCFKEYAKPLGDDKLDKMAPKHD